MGTTTDRFHGFLNDEYGQATVEAALTIPLLFTLFLMLLQPGIILYDRIVMQGAAAEGCRLLSTASDRWGDSRASCEAFVRHRLASVPQQECFHVHDPECSWDITLVGDEASPATSVLISNKIKPLPLLDLACNLLGCVDEQGYMTISVEATSDSRPGWVQESHAGILPSMWPGAWLE